MKSKVFCPVCRVSFLVQEPVQPGDALICPVCGAKLEVTETGAEIKARRFPQEPLVEITERVDTFARLKSYVFNENKSLVLEGLMQKFETYGDFYCPCRFDNVPENICPCLETRMNQVRKEGSCL
ncbi:ferredoxin-thioredoxin reductase catalytic domain-containing protein [Desulfotomaculum copahuensis]|uniref:Uncharacterized protein n=1 Tax=Desulfotomaculum copahuensis TaxID=1838280 RepID=A0A1B7LEF0_9FIRM|nr:ferredoxin-thioredoxin reductase catalytic domain-containing protein [Desulfotomaculum copahuensis]OAT81664.1 hypothetical protein A6M21_09630 [Desulfotomaculum copahuensis]